MAAHLQPNPWMVLPFIGLLLAIASGPLVCPQWWSRQYPKVALGFAAITATYYLVGLRAGDALLHTGREYLGFITFIGSLFVVAGGIHISVKGEATPFINVVYLALGAVISNVFGTTGASMLLIRPWLRMNKYRVTSHHVVFFIFIVSNIGGCLTPIGDPPLFLGYLRGIPFWWVARKCWLVWAFTVSLLLAIFFVLDRRNYIRAPAQVRAELAEPPDRWGVAGLHNLLLLGIILAALFFPEPPYLREGLMLAAAIASYYTTPRAVHDANHFTFHPIQEVALLFIGIFATMLPALDWLSIHADAIGKPSVPLMYWSTGLLSGVLDNAPTYLSFLQAACSAFADPAAIAHVQKLVAAGTNDFSGQSEATRATVGALISYYGPNLPAQSLTTEQVGVAFLAGQTHLSRYIVAVSVGAVFFGAATYIGNGPNFMVKSIAEQRKVRVPTFFQYIFHYTLPYLLPVLLLVWWIFFGR